MILLKILQNFTLKRSIPAVKSIYNNNLQRQLSISNILFQNVRQRPTMPIKNPNRSSKSNAIYYSLSALVLMIGVTYAGNFS
jgi:hypothetical protein